MQMLVFNLEIEQLDIHNGVLLCLYYTRDRTAGFERRATRARTRMHKRPHALSSTDSNYSSRRIY